MPSRKKKYNTATAPPVDWLWAIILERQRVYGLTLEEMAKIAGVPYASMRRMICKSPWSWGVEPRNKMCKHFGIDINFVPNVSGNLEVRVG